MSDFTSQFEASGYLAPMMSEASARFRSENEEWFALADGVSSALQRMAFKNMEAAATQSNSFEQKSVSHLVLLRSAGNLQGAILMAERGMVIEARTLVRSVLEDAFCMAALHDQPDVFLDHLKGDDALARKGQAKAILKAGKFKHMSETELNAFIAGIPKLKNLGMEGVAQLGPLRDQYLAYRVLSNDGAHPSATSLARHMAFNDERTAWTGFLVGPGRKAQIVEALNFAVMAALPIGIAYSVMLGDDESNEEFARLGEVYRALVNARADDTGDADG